MPINWPGHPVSWNPTAGCEASPGRRPCPDEWIDNIVAQCKVANVPVFMKQRDIDGKVVSCEPPTK